MKIVVGALVLILFASGQGEISPSSIPLEEVTLVSLSAPVERAVVRLPESGLALLEIGDEVPGTSATVRAVHPGRLILEERLEASSRRVWMEPQQDGQAGRLRYVEARPPVEDCVRTPANSEAPEVADHD